MNFLRYLLNVGFLYFYLKKESQFTIVKSGDYTVVYYKSIETNS